jgi:hypothetical protein
MTSGSMSQIMTRRLILSLSKDGIAADGPWKSPILRQAQDEVFKDAERVGCHA